MTKPVSDRRRQITAALRALQSGEHRTFRTVVETHREGVYYSARVERRRPSNQRLQDTRTHNTG